jgi:MOSC domain-containing protein YiiM/ferredoxin
MARLLSVNVGLPRDVSWRGEKVFTSVWKESVQGSRKVRRLNVDGDGQGDLSGHGGEHRAVLVYQMDSYRYWEQQLGRTDFTFGQFGENFTVEGLPDGEVCIGDRYRIGGALFEVTQPRVTCYRVGIRMGEPRMAALLVSHHRPGFYMRVLEEGEVVSDDEIVKIADGPERMTVAEIDALLYLPGHSRELLERSLRIPALSPGWKGSFQAMLEQETNQASTGNAGLTGVATPPPAWPGFRKLRVVRVERESTTVISLSFESVENPLPAPLPGQFLVLRFRPRPDTDPILRSYSMSGAPEAGTYRVSIKQEVDGAGSTYQPKGTPGPGPQVSFTRSGLTVAWRPDWHSLLELAEACDVPVRWSCRTGVCHTCECALIGGAIDYLPEPLEPPAEGNVLICCSRPRADIEIDL